MKVKNITMYKKIALISALLCTLTQYTSDVTPWLEIKPSYFFFSAYPMKDIYDDGGFEIQGSASVPICNYIDLYGSIGYREAWGHALNTCAKTNLTVIPVDIGLKPIFNFCERFYYFFAIGPRYFYFHQHNNSPYVDRIINGSGIGLFVNTGFNILVTDCLLLGIFGEYSYEKKTICPHMPHVFSNGSVQMGGFAFGISLGYAF
jgi:hypothetical protein